MKSKFDHERVQSMTGHDRSFVIKAGRRLSPRRVKKITKLLKKHACVWSYIATGKSLEAISREDWESFTPEAREALQDLKTEFEEG